MPLNSESETADDHTRMIRFLKRFLDGYELPSSQQGLSELREAVRLFLEVVAMRASPVVNQMAHERPASNFAEKKDLAKWINAQAADLGLAVRCEKSGKPGYFIGNASHDKEKGRFQLVLCEDATRRTLTATQLPEFELTPREGVLFPNRSWRSRSEEVKKNGISR